MDQLETLLSSLGSLNQVGKAFGILQLRSGQQHIDIALPRSETKSGVGHRGFEVQLVSNPSFSEAAARRDFTLNAMGINLLTGQLLDPFNGQEDLKNRCLRHVGPAFKEDSLRVYRAIQFVARFNLSLHPDTQAICAKISTEDLPKERCFEELKKCLLYSEKPSLGLELMGSLGVLRHYPELEALQGVPQDPTWHSEGDVWTHTLMVVDQMASLLRTSGIEDEKRQLVLMVAALCHDFGKPATTKNEKGRWRAIGHEAAGVGPTLSFLKRFTDEAQLKERVIPLVREHLRPAQLWSAHKMQSVSDAAIRRLALRAPISDLLLLAEADHCGRMLKDGPPGEFMAGPWLWERAVSLAVDGGEPTPLIGGKDLVTLGFQPGPKIGKLLDEVFEKQLDGEFSTKDQCIKWIKDRYM